MKCGFVKTNRRDFFKSVATLLAAIHTVPITSLVPPRSPYVRLGRRSLWSMVSHLGVLPSTNELSVCEGSLLDIEPWDGTGFPCLIANACSFGPNRERVWVYDFDLWNFRDDDHLGRLHELPEYQHFNSHASFYAARRFGENLPDVVKSGNGWLRNQFKDYPIPSRQFLKELQRKYPENTDDPMPKECFKTIEGITRRHKEERNVKS